MTYHPQAQQLIDVMAESGAPPLTDMTPGEARELPAILMETVGAGPHVAVVRDIEIPGPAGAIPAQIEYALARLWISWGIRPSGESEPAGITAHLPGAGFKWLYVPVRFEDQSIFVICQSRNDGSRVLEEAVRVWRNADGEGLEYLGRPEYDLTWDDDGKFVERATVGAGKIELHVEPIRQIHLGVGTGYGFDAEWRHGKYVGDLVVQERQWDLATDEGRAAMWGIVDSSARVTTVDGQVGHGLFEYMFL